MQENPSSRRPTSVEDDVRGYRNCDWLHPDFGAKKTFSVVRYPGNGRDLVIPGSSSVTTDRKEMLFRKPLVL
jgi:hypothetical protein